MYVISVTGLLPDGRSGETYTYETIKQGRVVFTMPFLSYQVTASLTAEENRAWRLAGTTKRGESKQRRFRSRVVEFQWHGGTFVFTLPPSHHVRSPQAAAELIEEQATLIFKECLL